MATEVGDERPTLFLRKATGLVRGWSVRDSMIYACLSTNVITLGLVEFAYQDAFPAGQLLTAVLISARLGVVPGARLQRAGGHDPPGGRRLRLAVPDPRQRDRLRDGRHRLVVHPLAVGADLRLGAVGGVLPAALGVVQRPVRRGLVRHPHRDLRRHADHDRAGRPAGLAGHVRVRQGAEVVLLRRPARRRDRRDPAPGLQPQRLHLGLQLRDGEAVRHEELLRGHARRRGLQDDRLHPGAVRRGRGVQPVDAAGADADVLPAVAELGHHPVRRDPRRQRLQARVQRHVPWPVDHRAAVGRAAGGVRQGVRVQLLPVRQRAVDRRGLRDDVRRTRCRSSRTRCCSPAGWCTTTRSRSC